MSSLFTNKPSDPKPRTIFLSEWIDPTDNCDVKAMEQRRRYYLTAMTMSDAYSDFVMGGELLRDCDPPQNFSQLWWIPEYNVDLGGAKGPFQKSTSEEGLEYFYRDFERGFAVVNRNEKEINIKLPRSLRDIHTKKNVSSITIPARDGRFLLDPE
jgi:hypothetical protein